MCVTCFNNDPREVRLVQWLECRQKPWAQALSNLLEEASESSKASFFAALGRIFP